MVPPSQLLGFFCLFCFVLVLGLIMLGQRSATEPYLQPSFLGFDDPSSSVGFCWTLALHWGQSVSALPALLPRTLGPPVGLVLHALEFGVRQRKPPARMKDLELESKPKEAQTKIPLPLTGGNCSH